MPAPQLGGLPPAAGGECMDAAQAARIRQGVRRLASALHAGLQPVVQRLRPSMQGTCCAAKFGMEPHPDRNDIDTYLSKFSCSLSRGIHEDAFLVRQLEQSNQANKLLNLCKLPLDKGQNGICGIMPCIARGAVDPGKGSVCLYQAFAPCTLSSRMLFARTPLARLTATPSNRGRVRATGTRTAQPCPRRMRTKRMWRSIRTCGVHTVPASGLTPTGSVRPQR